MDVLIVSTQFPYPPRSGFERRVHHIVAELSRRHAVTLLTYAHPEDRDAVAELRARVDVEVVERAAPSVARKRLGQAASALSPRPYACRAIWSAEAQRAIDALCRRRAFDVIQLESSMLCAFRFPPGPRIVLDEHNVEYEVFARMGESERSALRRAFNTLEFRRFRRFEQRAWSRVDACVVTAEREESIVRAHAGRTPVVTVPNGVDLDAFRPGAAPTPGTVVFNGILDYRPNVDAAHHLVDEVWPLVTGRVPDARLTIVGRGDRAAIERLRRPGVSVTGEVPDVRPYLETAAVVAVPIRMGGGTRLKVLEGLAMAKPMVSTALGCEGIDVRDGEHLRIADGATAFADALVALLEDGAAASALGRAGRDLMERRYSWTLAGERLEALYSGLGRRNPNRRSPTADAPPMPLRP